MSDSLTPLLADNRSALVTDLVGVIDAEVADQSGPVSYTHLTLPTILRV